MYAGGLLRGLFLLVVVVALGGASAAAVHAAKLYPVLEVVGNDAELGAVNDIAFDAFSLDASGETASVAITTAPAFNGSVTRAVGTRLGAAQVGVRSAPGTGAVTKYFGSLIVMDPAAYAADEGAVACAPDTHTAVWKLVVASAAGGKLTIPVAVDSTGKGYKLTMCLGAVRALSRTTAYVYLETSGMFRNPGKHGDYLFSATVTPFATDGTSNVDAAYELRGYESLPQTVNAEAKFNTTAKNLTVTGTLKFNGHPRGDANVHFYGGRAPQPRPGSRSGSRPAQRTAPMRSRRTSPGFRTSTSMRRPFRCTGRPVAASRSCRAAAPPVRSTAFRVSPSRCRPCKVS